MNQIIQKAIEGGWGTQYKGWPSYQEIACDPSFWQALGEACRWEDFHKSCPSCRLHKGNIEHDERCGTDKRNCTTAYALQFHEKNLTSGWRSAVEYLEKLIND